MPERSIPQSLAPLVRAVRRATTRARLALVATSFAAAGAAACTESFDGGATCPSLCPTTPIVFRDTIVDAVTLDTTLGGFPALGLSATLLVANRPDTLVTRGVMRFDVLPTAFRPNNGTDTASITTIDSVYLRLPLDTAGRRGTAPVTLEVFDVDTTVNDSVSAVVASLFRPDRRIGSVTFTPATSGDSIRVPLAKAAVQAKITGKSRLRLGLAIRQGTGQIRIIAFQVGTVAPTLLFDPVSDTLYQPIVIGTNTATGGLTEDAALAYQVYSILDRGSSAPDATTLVVGGFPAYRSYLRFSVPPRITDSATIVRAELLLTQRPSTFTNASDRVSIVPLVPSSTDLVTDVRRILDLSAEGSLASLDSVALVPRDSGLVAIPVLNLVRAWVTLPANQPRALAFRIAGEGAQSAELRFHSSEAGAAVRPRLRITYLPRTQSALP